MIALGLLAAVGLTQSSPAVPAEFRSWPLVYAAMDTQTGESNLYRANGDGSERRLVMKQGENPVWSPDRKRVAFVRDGDLWIVNADGADPWRVFRAARPGDKILGLSWGRKPGDAQSEAILFGRQADGGTDLYQIDMSPNATREAQPLTIGRGHFRFSERAFPAVSPSSRTIAYTANGDLWMSYQDDGRWATTRASAVARFDLGEGRGSSSTIVARKISWIPNARKFVYAVERWAGSGVAEIWMYDFTAARDPIANADRAKSVRLASSAMDPTVSRDGRWILATQVGANPGLVAISMDGRRRISLVPDGLEGNW